MSAPDTSSELRPERELTVSYTVFPNLEAQTKREFKEPWANFVKHVREPALHETRETCQLISLCDYGDQRTDKNSLRHQDNLVRCHGIEADYDGAGNVSLEEARRRLQEHGIRAVLHTSASHTPAHPRWHALLPLSEPALPMKRVGLVARANRALGGIVTSESFRLSQSFYVGRVKGAPYESAETTGRCIDEATDIEPQFFKGDGKTNTNTNTDNTDSDPLLEIVKLTGHYGRPDGPGKHHVTCPWAKLHTADSSDSATTYWSPSPDNNWRGGFKCQHAHCDTRDINSYRDFYLPQKPGAPEQTGEGEPEAPRVELVRYTREQLFGDIAPVPMILPGVPAQAYSIIPGSLSSYKTTLLLYLALWKATGWDILNLDRGRHGCDIGKAVIVSYEDNAERLFGKWQRVAQHGYGHIINGWGNKKDADLYAARAVENFRLISMAGKPGCGIVRREEGVIVPNTAIVDELVKAWREFAPQGNLLVGIDPLRLAISGSQNDDDGADTVVHVLNMLSMSIPLSGLVVASHTSKAKAQESDNSGFATAAYATSGSALYSQHARSNFHLARLSASEISGTFSRDVVTNEDAKKQRVVRLMHARLSHGDEGAEAYLLMREGTLHRIDPEETPESANEVITRYGPDVLEAILRISQAHTKVSGAALEADADLMAKLGQKQIRLVLKLLLENGYVSKKGATRDLTYEITDKGRELLYESRREAPGGGFP